MLLTQERPATRHREVLAPQPQRVRQTALDRMRGLVMVLMTLDHASLFLNEQRWHGDVLGAGDVAIEPAQFLTRWLAHPCAPTFLFLAGTALALSIARRRSAGESERAIDRHLFTRGVFIALLDPLFVSLGAGWVWLQVLWVIGLSFVLLVPLRRLPVWASLSLALGWCVLGEAVTFAVLGAGGTADTALEGFLLAPYASPRVAFYYPLLSWLAVMLLGWAFGQALSRRIERGERALRPGVLALAGLALLAVHVALRGIGAYGNMGFPPVGDSWLAWLDVCKQPPSLCFLCLELGLASLCTAALAWLGERRPVSKNEPLLVFGQTALFFYVAHWALLRGFAFVTGWKGRISLGEVWIVAAVALFLLYPACRAFRSLKRRHPDNPILSYL